MGKKMKIINGIFLKILVGLNFIFSLYDSATVQQNKIDVLGISIDTLRGKRPLSNTYRKHLQ